jgi:hypothetical protein
MPSRHNSDGCHDADDLTARTPDGRGEVETLGPKDRVCHIPPPPHEQTWAHLQEYLHDLRNAVNGPIMAAALTMERAQEIRSRCAASRLEAQEARAVSSLRARDGQGADGVSRRAS